MHTTSSYNTLIQHIHHALIQHKVVVKYLRKSCRPDQKGPRSSNLIAGSTWLMKMLASSETRFDFSFPWSLRSSILSLKIGKEKVKERQSLPFFSFHLFAIICLGFLFLGLNCDGVACVTSRFYIFNVSSLLRLQLQHKKYSTKNTTRLYTHTTQNSYDTKNTT